MLLNLCLAFTLTYSIHSLSVCERLGDARHRWLPGPCQITLFSSVIVTVTCRCNVHVKKIWRAPKNIQWQVSRSTAPCPEWHSSSLRMGWSLSPVSRLILPRISFAYKANLTIHSSPPPFVEVFVCLIHKWLLAVHDCLCLAFVHLICFGDGFLSIPRWPALFF